MFTEAVFYDIEANFVIPSTFIYFEGEKASLSSVIVIGLFFIA